MIKDNWYDLESDPEEGEPERGFFRGRRSEPTPVILYTSKSGLKSLISELQRIDLGNLSGRVAVEIPEMDYDYAAPFTHVEIREVPPEVEEKKDPGWWKSLVWIGAILGLIIFLSGFGLVRLVMDLA